ncbi:hypothetical protein DPMN_179718 [Dreissena polymorpha]|uniref:Uncharacterized protein n=1 Tax=Dreissena polymorpha TaxID=45954 RepID=A0A9D4INR9_DREPO|nr:hypothetical protein DPMN_179718 [Dreissena polymorpha]
MYDLFVTEGKGVLKLIFIEETSNKVVVQYLPVLSEDNRRLTPLHRGNANKALYFMSY